MKVYVALRGHDHEGEAFLALRGTLADAQTLCEIRYAETWAQTVERFTASHLSQYLPPQGHNPRVTWSEVSGPLFGDREWTGETGTIWAHADCDWYTIVEVDTTRTP